MSNTRRIKFGNVWHKENNNLKVKLEKALVYSNILLLVRDLIAENIKYDPKTYDFVLCHQFLNSKKFLHDAMW